MNDRSLDNPHSLHTEEVKMEEIRIARSWLYWKEEALCRQLYAAQEDQWNKEDCPFFMMVWGPSLNAPNRRRPVWLDKGTEYPNGTFENAMGMVQLHDILGRRNNCHMLEIRRRAAGRELLEGGWKNVFNALRFDDIVPNDNQVANFFADWAAQNHLHLSWQMKFVPQQTSLEAIRVELSPFTEETATLLSYIPRCLWKGNRFWMHKRTRRILLMEFPEIDTILGTTNEANKTPSKKAKR